MGNGPIVDVDPVSVRQEMVEVEAKGASNAIRCEM